MHNKNKWITASPDFIKHPLLNSESVRFCVLFFKQTLFSTKEKKTINSDKMILGLTLSLDGQHVGGPGQEVEAMVGQDSLS